MNTSSSSSIGRTPAALPQIPDPNVATEGGAGECVGIKLMRRYLVRVALKEMQAVAAASRQEGKEATR